MLRCVKIKWCNSITSHPSPRRPSPGMFSADSNSCDPSGAVRSNERSDAGLTNGCPRPRPVHGRGHEAEGIPGCIILAAPPFSGTSCGAAYPAGPTAPCTLVLLRACCLVAAEAMPVEIRTNAAASRTEGFKAARKDLGGGRAMKRTSLPLTTRVHHAARRRGGGVADRGACAAAGDAGNWISQRRVA